MAEEVKKVKETAKVEKKVETKKVEEVAKSAEATKEKKTSAKPKKAKSETTKKKRKSKVKGIFVKAKKKAAIARARAKKGKGRITLNKMSINLVEPHYVHDFIAEPMMLAGNEIVNKMDITINVSGGGFMGQAVAARAVIAKAIVSFTNNQKIKETFLKYDRLLLVDDPRRVESKKPLGKKARAKRQLSKR